MVAAQVVETPAENVRRPIGEAASMTVPRPQRVHLNISRLDRQWLSGPTIAIGQALQIGQATRALSINMGRP
jgi:hypothetical protein